MTAVLALVAGLGLAAAQAPVPATVAGQVRSAAGGDALSGVVVRVVGTARFAVTDEDGRYAIDGVSAGQARLRATRLGYESLEVVLTVPDGGHIGVDFVLILEPVDMPPVRARATPAMGADSVTSVAQGVTSEPAVVQVLGVSPGVSETGIAATARALLGPDPPVPDNVLYVRGAGTTLDLVLLDGAPVHAPFQLGGLLEPGLPPTVVSAVRYQGGAPARHDGGLADVLYLETRPGLGGRPHAAAFLDMISAGGAFEHGSDGAAFLVTARSLHGRGSESFIEGSFPQRYADALARLDVRVGDADRLSATGFWNEESVALLSDAGSSDSPRWGNAAGSLRYRGTLGRDILEVGAAVGEFRTRLPLGLDHPVVADGKTRRTRVTLDLTSDLRVATVGFGMHLDRLGLVTRFATRDETSPAGFDLTEDASATSLAGYVDGSWRATPFLRLSAGLRGSVFSGRLGGSLSPRARVDWLPSNTLLVSVSAGRFHQLVATTDTLLPVETAVLAAAGSGSLPGGFTQVAAAEASHFVVGFAYIPRIGSEFRVEGHWKSSRGLPVLAGADLENAGADVWLQHALGGLLVWGSYSAAWAWADKEGERTEIFSGRSFLRAGATTDLLDRLRLEADVAYGSGLEFGVVPRPSAPNLSRGRGAGPLFSMVPSDGTPPPVLLTVPRGSYLRLNLQATARFSTRIFGRRNSFFPYVRVINALDRPDALFYRFDEDSGLQPRAIGAIPLLPVVGVEWRM